MTRARLRLVARPEELAGAAPDLLERLGAAMQEHAPAAALALQKAAADLEPPPEPRQQALRDLLAETRRLYAVQLGQMLDEIGIALDERVQELAPDDPTADDQEQLTKGQGGPFVGPKGGLWADAAHTVSWRDAPVKRRAGVVAVDQKLVRRLIEKVDPEIAQVHDRGQKLVTLDNLLDSAGNPLPPVDVWAWPARENQTTRGTCNVTTDHRHRPLAIKVTVMVPHVSEGLTRDALAARMRSVLSHELAHATDPRNTRSTDGLAVAQYLNDPQEVRAHAHQMYRELITPAATAAASFPTWDHDLRAAPAGAVIVSHFAGNPEAGQDEDGTLWAPPRTDVYTKQPDGEWEHTVRETPEKKHRRLDHYDMPHQMEYLAHDPLHILDTDRLPQDPIAWASYYSPTWNKVKHHVTGEARRKFLRAIANAYANARAHLTVPLEKALAEFDDLEKAGTGYGYFIGPRGGRWADARHTIPWRPPENHPNAGDALSAPYGTHAAFASGSNHAGEIAGLYAAAQPLGVAVHELNRDAVEAIKRAAESSQVPVFVDSGAFSEVKFHKKAPPTWPEPITDEQWEERLDIMEELAGTLRRRGYVVAPDQVANQEGTLERLARYRDRVLIMARHHRARMIVPVQKGAQSMTAFRHAIEGILGAGEWVWGVPMKKDATSLADLAEFAHGLAAEGAEDVQIHLLGLGPRSKRFRPAVDAIRAHLPAARITSDAVRIKALVGHNLDEKTGKPRVNKRTGKVIPPRILTRVRDRIVAEGKIKGTTAIKHASVREVFVGIGRTEVQEARRTGWYDDELESAPGVPLEPHGLSYGPGGPFGDDPNWVDGVSTLATSRPVKPVPVEDEED
jgi:hypothetical protein